jgi:hypothetical protein
MSIATFESPQVATQQFFPWVLDAESDCCLPQLIETARPATKPVARVAQSARVTQRVAQPVAKVAEPGIESEIAARNSDARIGKPVRLGAVMIKLLKSYGITDEEIADGLATYAAQAELARAG